MPNLRLKLSGSGGRVIGNGSLLIAAAAPRSLSAIRWADETSLPFLRLRSCSVGYDHVLANDGCRVSDHVLPIARMRRRDALSETSERSTVHIQRESVTL